MCVWRWMLQRSNVIFMTRTRSGYSVSIKYCSTFYGRNTGKKSTSNVILMVFNARIWRIRVKFNPLNQDEWVNIWRAANSFSSAQRITSAQPKKPSKHAWCAMQLKLNSQSERTKKKSIKRTIGHNKMENVCLFYWGAIIAVSGAHKTVDIHVEISKTFLTRFRWHVRERAFNILKQ